MEESTDNEELLVHVGNLLHTTEGLKKSMEALVKGVAESLGGEQEGVSQETWTSFGRPMDEERLEPDVLEEEPMVSSAALEAQILGLDLPLNWPELIPEALFRQLKSELYSKDNSMKLSDALNFNIYGSSVLKGFNTVDVEESIKYFRETYDLDLREPGKNVVTIENIELKPADMFRLVPMVFLNDSTINYYLKVIQKYILSPAQTSECHFFNTYFFSKIRQEVANICMQQDVMLLSKHRAQLQTQMDPVNKKMRGWYKRIKLFQKKYLLLPVNKKDHWFAVVVANLPSLLQHFTQDLDLSTLPAELRPAILLLDPLVNVEESLELILRLFLETELKETLGPTYELKILQKEDPQDPDKSFLITDKNLPAYQLIVEPFDLDTKTEEYL